MHCVKTSPGIYDYARGDNGLALPRGEDPRTILVDVTGRMQRIMSSTDAPASTGRHPTPLEISCRHLRSRIAQRVLRVAIRQRKVPKPRAQYGCSDHGLGA
jgi:hypothetical protein